MTFVPCIGCFSENGVPASLSFHWSQPEWRNLRLLRVLRPRGAAQVTVLRTRLPLRRVLARRLGNERFHLLAILTLM